MNRKGFSLVELIIIIAIIAVLMAAMAPMLLRYVEKTRVSSDVQLCDSVHTALQVALSDPDVVVANDDSVSWRDALTTPGNDFRLDSRGGLLGCEYTETVKEQLGFDPFANATNNFKYMKSNPARTNGILCVVVNSTGSGFAVYIANSDVTGRGNSNNPIGTSYENLEATNVIMAK